MNLEKLLWTNQGSKINITWSSHENFLAYEK